MTRHPIKTLRALVSMGAHECSLTRVEASALIAQYEDLWNKVERYREMLGFTPADEVVEKLYGMDK